MVPSNDPNRIVRKKKRGLLVAGCEEVTSLRGSAPLERDLLSNGHYLIMDLLKLGLYTTRKSHSTRWMPVQHQSMQSTLTQSPYGSEVSAGVAGVAAASGSGLSPSRF